MEDAFFSRFPGFQPNPSLSTVEEFSRLAHHMNWSTGSKRYRKELAKFASTEFAHYYEIGNKLQNYQALCQELRLEGPFASVTQCRKALATVHINIFDLIDCRRTGATVQRFPNQVALKKYTRETQKIFPKQAAKADGFLKELLRKIF
ncbi:hypothetical protein BO70DRAFT_364041 [Aspergillus heteromorphus CBS 117.55]|uniref:Uncharacterized protein n=1 Tax=Aspergillus heteromorphus CBS 117.55 TaxID=1448321 RepID=A0A317VQC1_9EURO|nr:uncharacterized protein BO70DRAFT_364041 [Aspergillus heteromorphus CBS 117.55]PWY75491.1 hypothetical protein BO70DRAFT_364041 [Aspergillus heteromorphus CBS 117.55]